MSTAPALVSEGRKRAALLGVIGAAAAMAAIALGPHDDRWLPTTGPSLAALGFAAGSAAVLVAARNRRRALDRDRCRGAPVGCGRPTATAMGAP